LTPEPTYSTGEVAAERDGELVLGHILQPARCDVHVDGVNGGGVHAHEQLAVADLRVGDAVSQGGLGVEALERKGSHRRPFVLRGEVRSLRT
jgi:hypothetical protein